MRRHILGLLALTSFLLAIITNCYRPLESVQAAGAMGMRVGCVFGALWLAWPDLHRLPGWVWYALPLGIVAAIYARGILIFLAPALVTATLLFLLYRKIWRSPR